MRTSAPVEYQVSEIAWNEDGDFAGAPAWTRLFAPLYTLTVVGMPMHLVAYAVEENEAGLQVAANPDLQEELEHLQSVHDCAFDTVEINGHDYVVFALPHGT